MVYFYSTAIIIMGLTSFKRLGSVRLWRFPIAQTPLCPMRSEAVASPPERGRHSAASRSLLSCRVNAG